MAEEKVSIIYELKDLASSGISKIQKVLSDFGTSANQASKNAENLQKQLEGLGSVGKTLAVGAGIVSAGLGAVGYAALKAAGDFEQQRIAFEVMLGSAEKAKVLLEQLKVLAIKTPFEYTDIVEYSKRLLAMGIAAGDVTETIKVLGDISAGVGTDKMPQLVLALGQVKTAGKLMGQDLRQFTEAGVPLIDELAKRFNTTTSNIKDMVSEGKIGFSDVKGALSSMTVEGGKFFNLMERQSGTLTGQVSNLKDSIGFLAREFGNSLLPIVKPIVAFFTQLVGWISGLSPVTKTAITMISGFVFVVASLTTALGGFLAIVPMVAAGATTLGISFSTLASATGIGALIVAMGALSYSVYNNWNTIKGYFYAGISSVIDGIVSSLEFLNKFGIGFKEQIKNLKEFSKELENSGKTAFAEAQKQSDAKINLTKKTTQAQVTLEKDKENTITDTAAEAEKKRKGLLDSLLAHHAMVVSEMKANNDYSFNAEIELLDQLLAKKIANKEEEYKIQTQINNLIADNNKKTGEEILKNYATRMEEQKNLGTIAELFEIESQLRLLESDNLTTEQKQQHAEDLAKSKMNIESQFGSMYLSAAKDVGDTRLSIEKQVASGTIGYAKSMLTAQIDAWAAAEIGKATVIAWGSAFATLGGSLFALAGQVAGITAASAIGKTAINSIQLAEGGIVMPRPGGTQATIGEAGQPEAVIPLNSQTAQSMLGGNSDMRVIILDNDGVTTLAKGIWRKQKDLQRTGQIGAGL